MKGLADMKELRFLALDTTGVSIDRIGFDRVNLYLPNSLRFLRWTGYPFAFLHSTFQNLVGLDMHHSFIDQLWDDGDQKVLTKLKFLSITVSLLSTLDLRLAPNVERVSLVDSFLLEDLHMPAESPKLISLHLQNTNVMIFHLGITTNLENLSVHFFEYLAELHMPAECLKLKSLELSHLKLSTLHLGITPNLETLSLRNCTDMVELQIPAECPKLVYLELHNLNLRTLHLGIAPNLRFLYLSYLYLWALEFRLTPNLESLDLEKCYLVEVNAPAGCLKKLVNLNICASNPESSLVNICDLQSLRKLKLQGWSIRKAPKHLDRLECLDELRLWSTDIKYLPDSICMLKNLTFLELKFNRYLEKLPDDLGQLKSLEELILYECLVLRDIPNSICEMKRLEYFYLSNCILVETLPEEIGRLECLKRLDIEGTSIRHLPQSIYRLKGLCISGSTVILESCGLTSEIQTYENETFCYI
ncbi:disease resistance protein RPV1 isoform X1 [Tanacetum coccineum]